MISGSPDVLRPPPKLELHAPLFAPRLLVVEDDIDLVPIVARVVQQVQPDTKVDWASRVDEARSALANERYVAVLADYLLPDCENGLVLRGDCERLQPDASFAMMSALPLSLPDDACPLLQKPFTLSQCREFVRRLLVGRVRVD